MPELCTLTADEIETAASQHLGKLLFIFGRLETNLALTLAHSHPASDFERVIVDIEGIPFAEKLEALRHRINARQSNDLHTVAQWETWYQAATSLRTVRNRFAHGRWGFVASRQQVVHVVGLPGSPNKIGSPYSLHELSLEVEKAEKVAAEFSGLSARLLGILYPSHA
jgi:hypothetical protein